MPDLNFSQPERRSFLVPILVALAVLVLVVFAAIYLFRVKTVDVYHLRAEVVNTHTVFHSDTIVLGSDQSQNVLYLAETLKIDNRLHSPVLLDDFSLTFTNPEGAELTAPAVQKNDLANVELSFPQLKPLLTHPLLRETTISPGQAAEGTILFTLPIPKAMWDIRKSATIKIDVYHQPSSYLTLPK